MEKVKCAKEGQFRQFLEVKKGDLVHHSKSGIIWLITGGDNMMVCVYYDKLHIVGTLQEVAKFNADDWSIFHGKVILFN